jgi:hypothetical protein
MVQEESSCSISLLATTASSSLQSEAFSQEMKIVRDDLKEEGGTKIGIVKLGKAAGKVMTKDRRHS